MAKMTEAEILAKMKVLEDRIKAPSIWGRVPCGVRFEDLQDKYYEDTVRLLKKHYLSEELTYRSVKISEDKEGVDEFAHNLRIWMKDKMSIAAVKEGTEKLVGCLIMRIQEKSAYSRTFSRVKLTYNPLYSTVMKFYNEIEKPVNLFEKLGVRKYLKVYIMALKHRYRHRGLMKEMLSAAIALCVNAHIPAITGIFTTSRLHQVAEEMGFRKYHEIYYKDYKVDGKVAFEDVGSGNHGSALMAYRIPEVEELQEVEAQHSSRFNIQSLEEESDPSIIPHMV
ncbi:uncharacterized protein LOC133516407 isoform X1 [Cydia pomonella]|uniref:uncharacterized protein LOC133516407 isoform X1 n=1 Tax=Cydia pomonella TaxID=82600 RepID=UPI002ADD33AA|nr:uncharacterized protein LOC133516407 isoform X1 [Cydia pomonella]XP_061705309.1 uncharacterized protein LOC133516407 isoform X1 [Cydia pomonella]